MMCWTGAIQILTYSTSLPSRRSDLFSFLSFSMMLGISAFGPIYSTLCFCDHAVHHNSHILPCISKVVRSEYPTHHSSCSKKNLWIREVSGVPVAGCPWPWLFVDGLPSLPSLFFCYNSVVHCSGGAPS